MNININSTKANTLVKVIEKAGELEESKTAIISKAVEEHTSASNTQTHAKCVLNAAAYYYSTNGSECRRLAVIRTLVQRVSADDDGNKLTIKMDRKAGSFYFAQVKKKGPGKQAKTLAKVLEKLEELTAGMAAKDRVSILAKCAEAMQIDDRVAITDKAAKKAA